MNEKSKKILEEKQKREKEGNSIPKRKKTADDTKAGLSLNKKSDEILVNRFNIEWNYVLKSNDLENVSEIDFEKFIQVLISFKFLKYYNENKKK